VVAREVTLLPRHWDWLGRQPGGASVTLRRLVEEARRAGSAKEQARQASEAADRTMRTLAGDLPGFEEASRAFWRGERATFDQLTADWPTDVRQHLLQLAHRAWDTAATGLARRTVERDAGVSDAGFAGVDEARVALLPPDELARLEALVTRRAADEQRVAAGLDEPDIAALADDLVVDLDAATDAEREARTRSEAAAGAARLARDVADAARASAEGVVRCARSAAERVRDAAPVVRLANLAAGAGDNALGLTLGTFVLMRRFEDVVAAANERLLVMSDGRYELVRSDEKEDVRGRTGLAMRVIDHVNDAPRDPRTLSGGETFYVSLCLALGLADVVTAEAGGIDLGTLFVDEGFGSLDPHVLDQVLAELGRLRAGGRVVGVVSHVEALKQSIADRVEVRPRPDGTSTLTVRAG
jgi:exonuclease SbcC